MQNIKSVTLRDNIYTFWTMTYDDYKQLDASKKYSFNKKINNIFAQVGTIKEIEHCPNEFFCVANLGNEIVGFIHIVPEDFFNAFQNKTYATERVYVDHIAIKPKCQNKGLGAMLYAEAFGRLKKSNTVKVCALFTNGFSESAFKKASKKMRMGHWNEAVDGEVSVEFLDKIKELSR